MIHEQVIAILIVVLGAGGPLVSWINSRAKDKAEITTDKAEADAVVAAVNDAGISKRWESYADDIEERLNRRILCLENELDKYRDSHNKLFEYAVSLRQHIISGYPPPPPPWPNDIL